jgi:hypothetical protein
MKKLLLLSLLVLFSCSKEEEEEEVVIPIGRVNLVFSFQIFNNGSFSGGSSSPWLFMPYFSDEEQYKAIVEPWGTSDTPFGSRIVGLRGVDCFSSWNIKVPETEGYTFAGLIQGAAPGGGWRTDPDSEAKPFGDYPEFTKYVNCQGLQNPDDIFNEKTNLPTVSVIALWYPNSVL